MRGVPAPAAERFWELVNGPWCDPRLGGADCWEWMGGTGVSRRKWDGRGRRRRYGRFWLDGRLECAHRAALLLTVGPATVAGAVAAHAAVCVSTLCVNPTHLRWLLQSENCREGWNVRRRRAA